MGGDFGQMDDAHPWWGTEGLARFRHASQNVNFHMCWRAGLREFRATEPEA